jgi:DNA-binding response OmpR family regulator
MVCKDQNEADQVASLLAQHDAGRLVTYRKADDLIVSTPNGRVSLVILAGDEAPAAVGKMLKWLNRRWPHSPVSVVGSPGDNSLEMVARSGGASYLVRPIAVEEWSAVVTHAVRLAPGSNHAKQYRPV